MKKKQLASLNYKRFCSLEGSDFIASEFALEVILNIIDRFQVKEILELGLGIGSISDTVLKHSASAKKGIHYVGTEKNEFCLNALKNNVLDFDKIELYSELKAIQNQKFDLIIIDGLDDSIRNVASYCKQNTIIFIEGDRKAQTDIMVDLFPKHKYVNVITLMKSKPYAHGTCSQSNYVGGGQLIFTNTNLSMKMYWFKQKVATFIKRRIRILRAD